MPSRPITGLLFDLDGTLVDTAPDLIGALNHVLGSYDLAPAPSSLVQPLVGFGARAMLEAGFHHHEHQVSEEELTRAHKAFLAYYEENICTHSKAYDGVWDVTPHLYEEGYRLAVCTNKPEDLAANLMDQLDLARYFATICGSDTVSNRKPHKDHLEMTCLRAGMRLERCVMVGDSSPDIEAAKAASIPSVGFSYGYTPVPMEELGPTILLHHFADLPEAIKDLVRSY
ncbi:MAG: phosphoglycolate phosphatase [Cohaesibacter sp.]|nr:phosphoglycolate phosphatase [Cohaesibacter sp.]